RGRWLAQVGAQRVPRIDRLSAGAVRDDGRVGERVTFTWEQLHPAINASLNLTCFVFLVLGRAAIARGDVALDRRRMLSAFAASEVFLVSYLIRVATTGTHEYSRHGWDRTLYLTTLISHMTLAVVLVPLVITALRRALRADY